jgi:hypothetical protein
MFLETNGQPFSWSTFPRKAEEHRRGTTEVLKQIALNLGPELCGRCTESLIRLHKPELWAAKDRCVAAAWIAVLQRHYLPHFVVRLNPLIIF